MKSPQSEGAFEAFNVMRWWFDKDRLKQKRREVNKVTLTQRRVHRPWQQRTNRKSSRERERTQEWRHSASPNHSSCCRQLSAVLLLMLNFKQHAGIQHRAVAALVARPISERSAMQAHIEHRHPTDVSSCYFEKALFLSVARQAFVLLWKSS